MGGPFITTAEAVNRLRTAYALVYEASYIAANRKEIYAHPKPANIDRCYSVQTHKNGAAFEGRAA